mmetsp:Transcript_50532/g.152254  ORF Transcript_50532/g.152254 Transcript_50532/m.152254 type:complete len:202 (-) Transcript_50532:998-1603(-)
MPLEVGRFVGIVTYAFGEILHRYHPVHELRHLLLLPFGQVPRLHGVRAEFLQQLLQFDLILGRISAVEFVGEDGIVRHEGVVVEEYLVERRIVHLLEPFLHVRDLIIVVVGLLDLDNVGFLGGGGGNFGVPESRPVPFQFGHVGLVRLLPVDVEAVLLNVLVAGVALHLIQPLGKYDGCVGVELARREHEIVHVEVEVVQQ